MRLTLVAAVLLSLAGLEANAQALKTEDDKTLYALGLSVGRSLELFQLTPAELEIVKKGLSDAITKAKPAVELETYGHKIQDLANARRSKQGEANLKTGNEYLAKAAKEKGATKLPSGVIYKETKAGTGESPKATDTVKVHYRGTLLNGTEFDSSYKRGEPISFPLNAVIPCWTEGVQKLKVGGKAQLVCPANTAYGERGSPPNIPPQSTLIFDVELIGIEKGGAQQGGQQGGQQ